jgi:uncharacterized protein (TIGR00251 family)
MPSRYEVEAVDGGRASLVRVRAQPRARRAGLVGTWNGCLKIAVSEPPEDGRANARLLALLAEALALAPSALELVSGLRAREKRVRVPLPPSELRARLARHLPETD